MLKNVQFYNNFHKFSNSQNKIIDTNNFTYATLLKIVNLYIKPNDSVLDVGCGVGVLSLYYGNKCKSVTGVDISDRAIYLANQSVNELGFGKKVKFEVLDFPNKFLSRKFDKIIFSETLEHIGDENKALSLINKMLKRNGKLIITVPSQNSVLYKLGLAKKFDLEVGHLRRYTVASLKSVLKRNDFKILKVYKREGLIRNILFFIRPFKFLIKFMKGIIGIFVNWLDFQTLKIIGESQLIIIATKKKQ